MSTLFSLAPFMPENILTKIHKLTPELADKLDCGVVKVDDDGFVELYNKYNYTHFADFKGLNVIGKNYFTEIAPCSNNFLFFGRFKRGVESKSLNSLFDYVFTYKLTPTKVRVHLHRDSTGGNWILVKKL